jgi:serine/threonine-protein kinase
VIQGPLLDALACAPLAGSGAELAAPDYEQARARLEILIWDAGASAQAAPELGPWVWGSRATFEALVGEPSGGSLRGRVLAARCLEISIPGMPARVDFQVQARAQQVLQPLLMHPEPMVSTHAARALGLLAGKNEHLEATILDWLGGSSQVLRQRGMTAFASLPASRLRVLGHELRNALDIPGADDWALSAAAAGTPYLFVEARELWDEVARRILSGRGGSRAARSLARGLSCLWRGGTRRAQVEGPLSDLRQLARRTPAGTIEDWRNWLGVLSATDPVEGAERDPLDVEMGLENLVHQAAQYEDEEADARAARFAESLQRTFEEARRIAVGEGSLRHRSAGMNALEGCARAMALRLWGPQLRTFPRGEPIPEPDLAPTWQVIASAPTELLDLVKERRASKSSELAAAEDDELSLEVLALRLGGYALDACGGDIELGPGRGPTAHQTCRWLRKLDGVADGSRELPPVLRAALSSIFWRLVDTTRGTALGEVDDVEWLGPFAAWWALVIDRPAMLQQLATSLPMIREGALEACTALAESIRSAVSAAAPDGSWGRGVGEALGELRATGTELEASLTGLARCMSEFSTTSGRSADIEPRCLGLVLAAERLQAALADPVKALHPAAVGGTDSLSRATTENAPRIAALLTRAIRARELSMLDVWFTSLGPVASALVEGAVKEAVNRTPPPPPSRKKVEPELIEGYELVRQLGEGGVGKVWLVRKPGADRLFVLKIPKREALAGASETEKRGLLESFQEEARALAGLYHPNVANIIDRGVTEDVPYLVLELLIGCDLSEYSKARACTLFEMRQIVLDACAGLQALHGAHLVDPEKHRDPARVRPLSTVVIDFGMVRPMRVAADASGRFVAGTPGYIAPDQVLDPVELDCRADVYALAGTIYNATTGRSFFDDITSPRDRIFAHMQREPLEDANLLKGYPAELVKLMRSATALDPKERPYPIDFGRAFEACL